jgi:hypothetical protein
MIDLRQANMRILLSVTKRFTRCSLELKDIGLYLYPDIDFRANMMKRIKNNFKVLSNAVDDPFQRKIGEF